MNAAVYIICNRSVGIIYVGVTSNLARRIYQHRMLTGASFPSRYGLTCLVYYEPFERIVHAIEREKALKELPREEKIRLIEGMNPTWRDLYDECF